jgi:hypothetical protein
MTHRRAISPPPGSITVPKVASLKAPADMVQTVAPPAYVRRELESARLVLVKHADRVRAMLGEMNCSPRELTSVLAALDYLTSEP